MRYSTTIILFVCVILLGGFILLFERSSPTTDELKGRSKRIFAYEEGDLTSLEVRRDKGVVRLEREGEGWRLAEPGPFGADGAVADGLASRVALLEADRMVEGVKEAELATYGLDKPRLEGTVRAGEAETAFSVGGSDATRKKVYLAIKGLDKVYAVDKDFAESLERPVEVFRSKAVLDISPLDVTSLKVTRQGEVVLQADKREGLWRLTVPQEMRADGKRLDDLVRQVADLRAERFVEDAPKDIKPYGLDSPAIEVALKGEGKDTELLVGAVAEGQVYVRRRGSDPVMAVKAKEIEPLRAASFLPLADRKVMRFSEGEVNRIDLVQGDRSVRLERKEDAWTVTAPERMDKVEQAEVEGILDRLGRVEAIEVLAQAPESGLDVPAGKVTLSQGDKELDSLIMGAERGAYRYARRGEGQAVLVVPADLLALMAPLPQRFKDRTVLEVDRYGLSQVEMTLPDGSEQRLVKEEGLDWTLDRPLKAKADLTVLNDFLDSFAGLKAHSFADKGAVLPEGVVTIRYKGKKDDKDLEGTLTVATSPASRGDQGEGLHLAVVQGQEGEPFFVADSAYRALTQPLVPKKVLSLTAAEVVSLKVEGQGGPMKLVYRNEGWHRTEPVSGEVGQDRVQGLLSGLTDLEALRFRSFGKVGPATEGLTSPFLVLTVELKDGQVRVLTLGDQALASGEESVAEGRLAAVDGLDGVFVLGQSVVDHVVEAIQGLRGEGSPDRGALPGPG